MVKGQGGREMMDIDHDRGFGIVIGFGQALSFGYINGRYRVAAGIP